MASRNEVLTVLTIIEVAYPASFQNMDGKKAKAMSQLWTEMFQDTDPNDLSYAVKFFIANNNTDFPPSIGQINEIITNLRDDGVTEIEAWQMVKRAIQRAGGDRDAAREAYDRLPESVRAPIRPYDLIEWGYLNSDTLNTSICAAYRRSFTTKKQQARETKALPQAVRNLLAFRNIDGE